MSWRESFEEHLIALSSTHPASSPSHSHIEHHRESHPPHFFTYLSIPEHYISHRISENSPRVPNSSWKSWNLIISSHFSHPIFDLVFLIFSPNFSQISLKIVSSFTPDLPLTFCKISCLKHQFKHHFDSSLAKQAHHTSHPPSTPGFDPPIVHQISVEYGNLTRHVRTGNEKNFE